MRLPVDSGTVKFAPAAPVESVLDHETQTEMSGQKSFGVKVSSRRVRTYSVIGARS